MQETLQQRPERGLMMETLIFNYKLQRQRFENGKRGDRQMLIADRANRKHIGDFNGPQLLWFIQKRRKRKQWSVCLFSIILAGILTDFWPQWQRFYKFIPTLFAFNPWNQNAALSLTNGFAVPFALLFSTAILNCSFCRSSLRITQPREKKILKTSSRRELFAKLFILFLVPDRWTE